MGTTITARSCVLFLDLDCDKSVTIVAMPLHIHSNIMWLLHRFPPDWWISQKNHKQSAFGRTHKPEICRFLYAHRVGKCPGLDLMPNQMTCSSLLVDTF